jgi:hypothetical protein
MAINPLTGLDCHLPCHPAARLTSVERHDWQLCQGGVANHAP